MDILVKFPFPVEGARGKNSLAKGAWGIYNRLTKNQEAILLEQIIKTIVVTGGPCAGKTTAMSWIQSNFTKKGYRVLFVPETATEFICGGVAPWTCQTNAHYQVVQMTLQREKERLFEKAARGMPKEKILIVCDRGMLDNRAYMDDEEAAWALEQIGANEVEMRDQYDAVFHLVTAAKGAEEFYTTANNSARIETVEQAMLLKNKAIHARRADLKLKKGEYLYQDLYGFDVYDLRMEKVIGTLREVLERGRSFIVAPRDADRMVEMVCMWLARALDRAFGVGGV